MKSKQLHKESRQLEVVGHLVHFIDAGPYIVNKFDGIERNGKKIQLRHHQHECAHNPAARLQSGQKAHPKVRGDVEWITEIVREI